MFGEWFERLHRACDRAHKCMAMHGVRFIWPADVEEASSRLGRQRRRPGFAVAAQATSPQICTRRARMSWLLSVSCCSLFAPPWVIRERDVILLSCCVSRGRAVLGCAGSADCSATAPTTVVPGLAAVWGTLRLTPFDLPPALAAEAALRASEVRT